MLANICSRQLKQTTFSDAVFTGHITIVKIVKVIYLLWAPQGFWGSGENDKIFSGSWGALVIILGELGSKLIILGI